MITETQIFIFMLYALMFLILAIVAGNNSLINNLCFAMIGLCFMMVFGTLITTPIGILMFAIFNIMNIIDIFFVGVKYEV